MNRKTLIEKINVLGPWVHGYFDLGDNIIIQDRDVLQLRRLKCYKNYFIDIIERHYGKKSLKQKTLCDIGCNTGYFLFELYKYFGFKRSIGFEPRDTNLAKARFIAKYFKLPADRYQLKKMDVLNPGKNPAVFDVVIFPGVLHHIDDQILALRNLYKMTRDICIIDTHVLPDELNTPDVADKLELKDVIYNGIHKSNFGIIGYKLEDSKLDGSTVHAGIVGIPTLGMLRMMLRHVGFTDVSVYRDFHQLKKEVYHGSLHRDVCMAIVVAKKSPKIAEARVEYDQITKDSEYKELATCVPEDIIKPCYDFIKKEKSIDSLPFAASLICKSQCGMKGDFKNAVKKYTDYFSQKPYYAILQTFKYAPDHKIPFEYAKTCFIKGKSLEAKKVLQDLIGLLNLDWRIVYKSYHLLSLIMLQEGNKERSRRYNLLALQAFPAYYPAQELKEKIMRK